MFMLYLGTFFSALLPPGQTVFQQYESFSVFVENETIRRLEVCAGWAAAASLCNVKSIVSNITL